MPIILQPFEPTTNHVILQGGLDRDLSIPAGQHLKIETTPAGEELLDAECPAGKHWDRVSIFVVIRETDA